MSRLGFLALGWAALALGFVGVVVPGLPTTVFMILAAFAFGRASPRLHAWLTGHQVFGPPIRDWEERGAISRRGKTFAVGTMAVILALSFVFGAPAYVIVIQASLMALGAAFILTRPH